MLIVTSEQDLPGGPVVKNLPANAGGSSGTGSILGLGRSPGGGNDNPLQYSCLENPTDRGAWWATVHGVAKSWTRLSMHSMREQLVKLYIMQFGFRKENIRLLD